MWKQLGGSKDIHPVVRTATKLLKVYFWDRPSMEELHKMRRLNKNLVYVCMSLSLCMNRTTVEDLDEFS